MSRLKLYTQVKAQWLVQPVRLWGTDTCAVVHWLKLSHVSSDWRRLRRVSQDRLAPLVCPLVLLILTAETQRQRTSNTWTWDISRCAASSFIMCCWLSDVLIYWSVFVLLFISFWMFDVRVVWKRLWRELIANISVTFWASLTNKSQVLADVHLTVSELAHIQMNFKELKSEWTNQQPPQVKSELNALQFL